MIVIKNIKQGFRKADRKLLEKIQLIIERELKKHSIEATVTIKNYNILMR